VAFVVGLRLLLLLLWAQQQQQQNCCCFAHNRRGSAAEGRATRRRLLWTPEACLTFDAAAGEVAARRICMPLLTSGYLICS
jgi:hypothetical protein